MFSVERANDVCPVTSEGRDGTFPEGFMWGIGSSAYQVEGAWNTDGKGESFFDSILHSRISGIVAGDIACDSYHKYQEDIKLIKDIGCSHYRFSIAWSRILPEGIVDKVNLAGESYYNNLIDGLLKAGIQPIITLIHFNVPMAVMIKNKESGGDMLVKLTIDYAEFCFKTFGDRVKFWTTINEPHDTVYALVKLAPGTLKDKIEKFYYYCRAFLKAHAGIYQIYDSKFRQKQGGQIGITMTTLWPVPKDPTSPADLEAVELMLTALRIFTEPIFGDGDWPLHKISDHISSRFDLSNPSAPIPQKLSEDELQSIKGTSDYFGLNFYSATQVSMADEPVNVLDRDIDLQIQNLFGLNLERSSDWTPTSMPWIWVTPFAIRAVLNWIQTECGAPPVLILENGLPDPVGERQVLQDNHRIAFMRDYLWEVLKAIREDGCNVIGYSFWSLLDSIEWEENGSSKCGVVHVNFSDPERKRTPKASTQFYANIIKQNGLENMTDY